MRQAARTGGRRPAQGRASSSWAASANSRRSVPNGAAKCAPVGRPAGVQNSGTDVAGWPLA